MTSTALRGAATRMSSGVCERRRLEDLFGRYVSPEVAQHALVRGPGLGGARRHASVLFVDVVASSQLAEDLQPETVVQILNRYFSTVVAVAASEGGWVNRFVGDGALCVFGAPDEQPDSAARALRAARRLATELEAVRRDEPLVRAGVGVSSGLVVAGNIGAEHRYEYTLIGDAVNEASRVTEEAKAREPRVLASGAAVSASGGEAAHWHLVEHRQLRGRREPTALFAPAGTNCAQPEPRLGDRNRIEEGVPASVNPSGRRSSNYSAV